MLSDITLGQFYPTESFVHKLDPRVKILLLIAFVTAVFLAGNLTALLMVLLYVALCSYMSRLPAKMLIRNVRSLRFILIFTFLLNVFFMSGETVIVEWGFLRITLEGLKSAVLYSARLLLLVIGSSLLTLSTPPVVLTDGLERLLSPLRVIHFPVHELAMMMTIALRFIPTLLEEADKIMQAQKARGADFESGNLLKRAKAMVPLLVPLFVSAFRRAGDLAMAMEARCYHGGEGRTRLRVLKCTWRDAAAALVTALLLFLTVLLTRVSPL